MEFVAPFSPNWLVSWIGIPAAIAGIPIALHFFFRSRYRTVPWAAMKFLLTSIEQTSRRLKFQELLLLLLRVALLVLLVWAIQRPSTKVLRGAGRGDAVDAVFVFDTSFSMGARDGDKTRLERGQDEALRILEKLPPHSTVQIIASADRSLDEAKKKKGPEQDEGPEETGSTLLGPREPANIDQARVIIRNLKTTSLATDLHPGIAQGGAVLQRGQASNKEMYVFSDMQKRGFEQQAASLAQALQDAKEKATIHLVRCGVAKVNNIAVVGIAPQSGTPRPGERVGFAVLVRNTGAEAVKDIKVSLTIDEDEKTTESVDVPQISPGETRSVTLTGKVDKAGLRLITAKAGVDDLDGDNRFDQVVLVRDQVNVLVVDGGANPREPEKSSSFFLSHALAPVKEAERGRFYLEPRVITPRLAAPALLAKQDLVVLVNVSVKANAKKPAEVLAADFVAELAKFVKQGKALLIFAGDNVDAEAYNQVLGKAGLLPLPVKGIVERAAAEPLLIDRSSFQLPAYLQFKVDDYYADFAKVNVSKALELDGGKKMSRDPKRGADDDDVAEKPGKRETASGTKEGDADPLTIAARFNNGQPAIVARKVGAGEVILVATAAEPGFKADSPAPTWTDFPLRLNLYVPFVHITVGHLLHGQTQVYNLTAGETLAWQPTDKKPRSYALVQPDGKQVRLGLPALDEKQNRQLVFARDLAQSGVYRMIAKDAPGGDAPRAPENGAAPAPKGGVPIAVTPDLRESEDLETLSAEQIDRRLGFSPVHITAGVEEAQNQEADRLNREWTTWFLIGVLILVLCEAVLAYWCGRAW